MKKCVFTGVATALVTPFNQDLSINYGMLEKLIEFQIKGGVDALVLCGTTGESATLSDQEKLENKIKELEARISELEEQKQELE